MHVSRVGYSQKGVGSSTDVTSSGDSNERESDFSTSGNERSLDEILHKDDSFFSTFLAAGMDDVCVGSRKEITPFRTFSEREWTISVSDFAQN